MTNNLVWFQATTVHRQKVESAMAVSKLGGNSEIQLSGDSVHVVVRGTAELAENLSCGRVEGSVSIDTIADWFARFLTANTQGLVVIEDVVHSPTDSAVLKRDRPGWWLDDGVAWPVFANETAADAGRALGMLRGGPQFYGFYQLPPTWPVPVDGTKLSDADLVVLRSSLVAALIDVYDWDGLILWKRDVQNLFFA